MARDQLTWNSGGRVTANKNKTKSEIKAVILLGSTLRFEKLGLCQTSILLYNDTEPTLTDTNIHKALQTNLATKEQYGHLWLQSCSVH